mmetsp:Transcript_44423/g.96567  ORF Transcript_44423/g.96567 Transcript_44423/m.96567 type:complete len:673 (+) Transcript_44423:99-2117(+)|eukprot:CAMPEP_0170575884 /NCGR_PEP_ID=MMETSP0224-20130122/4101_1 /TAXON_ID=285029 /ORGANISM="Togula jolla, Strain CCCM 725" /LENGTH=672 /DNA_ID=CAMNT_0010898697 /DNA_START=38 /DNA_END=2056 /DNA_ORIENTATION=+
MATAADPPHLGFTPLTPAPDVGFWQELMRQKLDVLRLDTFPIPVHAHYEAPAAQGSQEKCFLMRESFNDPPSFPVGCTWARGELKNFNTVEEFREFLSSGARAAYIAKLTQTLREDIISGAAMAEPVRLRPLVIVTFADLKKYHFAYAVALPVLSPPKSWPVHSPSCTAEEAGFTRKQLCLLSQELRDNVSLATAGVFLLLRCHDRESEWAIRPLSDLASVTAPDDDLTVGFVDPSSSDVAPGWPLRNLLLALAHHRPGKHRILAFRDPHLFSKSEAQVRSRVFFADANSELAASVLETPTAEAQFAGWSKIQTVDLTTFLDKQRMAADAVDLNVKLMKWRLLPELEPARMSDLRFLLLGAGTLGCSVSRLLMGWGVRRMTFVDSGKVSLSNPVRQSLFTHGDAAAGRPKAEAACEALRAVMPDAQVKAVELEVPMPGHPKQSTDLSRAIKELQDLVATHDVVCMLTDSRESRWLPSLLVAAAQKSEQAARTSPPLGLTIALGFDTFLVSRQSYRDAPAACYFCNDVTAPTDSLTHRTLDQQCTVTRPGLSGLAAGVGVELIAALTQHRDGFGASAAPPPAGGVSSLLGAVPHQVRGYLADFRLAPSETQPFEHCICCSQAILERYASEGSSFVESVIANSAQLEDISGLAQMKAAVREDEVVSLDDFDEDL